MNSFLGGKSVSVNKFLPLILIVLLLSHLLPLSIIPANVQAASKPSVPQFTVKFIDNSYDLPPKYTTNPYTGETIQSYAGYHIKDQSIEITIKNQPFTPYTNTSGSKINLYYLIQYKGHFGEEWYPLTKEDDDVIDCYYVQSNSKATTVVSTSRFVDGYQVDFRVQAIIGNTHPGDWFSAIGHHYSIEIDAVASSDWSSIQTITIGESSSSQTPTTPPTNAYTPPYVNQTSLPESQLPDFMFHPFFLLGISALFAGLIVIVVMMFLRRHLKTATYHQAIHN